MLAEVADALHALRLPPESGVEIEGGGPGVERWTICPPGEARRAIVLRAHGDGELAANHVAVSGALLEIGFPHMPKPLAVIGAAVAEGAVAGVSALALVPPPGSVEAAMRALAALHTVGIREGSRWELQPGHILPGGDLPLHRLGFAAHEREAAGPWLRAARDELLGSPWGFTHGEATAQHVLLAPARAWLVSYHAAGFGPQLFDVAAFLLTAGIPPDTRKEAAIDYATARGMEPGQVVGMVDLAGILWGIGELLTLPRRSIEIMGDDASSAALNTAALRIERGIREASGGHATAARIRAALWPA